MERYEQDVNPCLKCGCWDPDLGCMMPSIDRSYACSLETDGEDYDGE